MIGLTVVLTIGLVLCLLGIIYLLGSNRVEVRRGVWHERALQKNLDDLWKRATELYGENARLKQQLRENESLRHPYMTADGELKTPGFMTNSEAREWTEF